MMRFLINSLSASVPFGSIGELESQFGHVTDCFQLLLPLMDANKVELIFDESIERKNIVFGLDGFAGVVAQIRDGDVRKRWYHFTRNRSSLADQEVADLVLVGEAGSLRGTASLSLTIEGRVIGLGGSDAHKVQQFNVYLDVQSAPVNLVDSVCDTEGTWRHIPRYEASPKHRRDGYVREGGEVVSPMTLHDAEAQKCLFQAIEHEGEYFGKYGGNYYRFILTGSTPSGAVYHGFDISSEEIPYSVLGRVAALPELGN